MVIGRYWGQALILLTHPQGGCWDEGRASFPTLLAIDEIFRLEGFDAKGTGAADGDGGLDAIDLEL